MWKGGLSSFFFFFPVSLAVGEGGWGVAGKGGLNSKIFNKHYNHINMFGPESRHVLQEIVDTTQTSV